MCGIEVRLVESSSIIVLYDLNECLTSHYMAVTTNLAWMHLPLMAQIRFLELAIG